MRPEEQVKFSVDTSNARGEFAAALAKAQSAMGAAKKDSENPHFRSRYADLASVWEACRGPLTANGIAVVQLPNTTPEGVEVVTVLIHTSGQQMRSTCWLPVGKKDAQGYGSAITYARRYALAAMAGVVADEDDDGNAAVGPSPEERRPPKRAEQVLAALRPQNPPPALPPEAPTPPEPKPPTVSFGPYKGRHIAELSDNEITHAIAEGTERLDGNKGAKWAGKLATNLAALQAELEKRLPGA